MYYMRKKLVAFQITVSKLRCCSANWHSVCSALRKWMFWTDVGPYVPVAFNETENGIRNPCGSHSSGIKEQDLLSFVFPLNNKHYTIFGTSMCPRVKSNLLFFFLISFAVVTARKEIWECHSWNEIIKKKTACGIVIDTVKSVIIILNETLDFRSTRGVGRQITGSFVLLYGSGIIFLKHGYSETFL